MAQYCRGPTPGRPGAILPAAPAEAKRPLSLRNRTPELDIRPQVYKPLSGTREAIVHQN